MTFMKSKISSQSFLVTMTVRLGKLQKERERERERVKAHHFHREQSGSLHRRGYAPQKMSSTLPHN